MSAIQKSSGLTPLLVTIASALGLFVSYWYYLGNGAKLQVAATNLRECERLATKIAQAKQSPQHARLETWSLDDLGGIIEQAASEAQIERDKLLRIDPQAPKRVGKTDYLEQETEVELVSVKLLQLVDFIYRVCDGDDQLQVGTLRMRVPYQANEARAEEFWLADIVLTQRIYQPTTPKH